MKKINLVCLLLAALMILSSCAVSASTFPSDFSQNNPPEKEPSSATPQPSLPSSGVSPTPSLPSVSPNPSVSPEPSVSPSPSRLDSKDIPDPVVRNSRHHPIAGNFEFADFSRTPEEVISFLDSYADNYLPAAICLVRLEKLNVQSPTLKDYRHEMTMELTIQKIYRSNKEFDLNGSSVGDTITAIQHRIQWYPGEDGLYHPLPRDEDSLPLLEPEYNYIVLLFPDESEDVDYAAKGCSLPLSEYSYDPLYNAKLVYLLQDCDYWMQTISFVRFFCPGFPSREEIIAQESTKEFLNWEVEIGYETVTGKPFPQDRLDRYKEKGWI